MTRHMPMTPVPIRDAAAAGNLKTRIILADGRKITLDNTSVEIIPGHALIPASFASKIGAVPENKGAPHPSAR